MLKNKPPLPHELEKLYISKRLSTYKIADEFGYNPKTVYNWLKKYHIPTRSIRKPEINKKLLQNLYLAEKMSLKKIGKTYGMTPSGILKRIRKLKIKTRSSWETNTSFKKPFAESDEEKAYMIGFRLGDLGIRQPSRKTMTVLVGTNTTHIDQINLVKWLFQKYSKVWISKPNASGVMSFSTILHPTFSFLVPKKDIIESWIYKNDRFMASFTAGYIDAEGSFGVYNKRAKFRVGSYDKTILKQINSWFKKKEIKSLLRLERKKKIGQNKDFWRITINDAASLGLLYTTLFAKLRHKNRIRDFIIVRKNLLSRFKNGTIRI